jgi:hypothetical protein
MDDAYVRTGSDALKHFAVTEESGLSDARVKEQTAKFGRNGKYRLPLFGTYYA